VNNLRAKPTKIKPSWMARGCDYSLAHLRVLQLNELRKTSTHLAAVRSCVWNREYCADCYYLNGTNSPASDPWKFTQPRSWVVQVAYAAPACLRAIHIRVAMTTTTAVSSNPIPMLLTLLHPRMFPKVRTYSLWYGYIFCKIFLFLWTIQYNWQFTITAGEIKLLTLVWLILCIFAKVMFSVLLYFKLFLLFLF
jgi:hypothetical protein